MQGTLKFPLKPTPEDIIVRLCEPKENKDTNTKYIKSTYRFTKTIMHYSTLPIIIMRKR